MRWEAALGSESREGKAGTKGNVPRTEEDCVRLGPVSFDGE